MEILICGIAAVIVLLYQLHKQLISIYNNLPNVIKQNESDMASDEIDDKEYSKDNDYTDGLAKWVEENNGEKEVACYSKCKLYRVSLGGNIDEEEDKNISIEKWYTFFFKGIMKSRYGILPSKDNVCDFNFIIHFGVAVEGKNTNGSDVRFPVANFTAEQDTYHHSGMDDCEYYEGRHTVTLDLYEDIAEFEKYKPLLYSGKQLGAEVSFDIDTSKIKMDKNKIEGYYTRAFIGKLSWFDIFVVDKQ